MLNCNGSWHNTNVSKTSLTPISAFEVDIKQLFIWILLMHLMIAMEGDIKENQ